ncbi:hypothetical protein ONS95_003372 [Cadophora gregata]|uniref:uncharacterized protein n=1 Tax=Cadophora gregata TaxID=51156 RepID=UPI0026DAEDFA|nr:uncharacterized protein ONS95_003372 [Cadophora gregata]KAK0108574.1 hypothetical protein ONS95_003372 [Cadophora gregata]
MKRVESDLRGSLSNSAKRSVPHPNAPRSSSLTSDDNISSASDIRALPPSSGEYLGRLAVKQTIAEEAAKAADKGQELSVYVCGAGTLQNDVRNTVAERNLGILKGGPGSGRGVYLYFEHFGWAEGRM